MTNDVNDDFLRGWSAEQRAYDCCKGPLCGCISPEERAAAEQQLAEAVARAYETPAAYDTPKGVEP